MQLLSTSPNTFKAMPLDAVLLYQPTPLSNKKVAFLWVQYPYSPEQVSIVSLLFSPRNRDCSEIQDFYFILVNPEVGEASARSLL